MYDSVPRCDGPIRRRRQSGRRFVEASRKALQQLLETSQAEHSVKDILEVQRELNRTIEAMESQKKRVQTLQFQSVSAFVCKFELTENDGAPLLV